MGDGGKKRKIDGILTLWDPFIDLKDEKLGTKYRCHNCKNEAPNNIPWTYCPNCGMYSDFRPENLVDDLIRECKRHQQTLNIIMGNKGGE